MSEITSEHQFKEKNDSETQIEQVINDNFKIGEFEKPAKEIETFLNTHKLANERPSKHGESEWRTDNLHSTWEDFDEEFRHFLKYTMFTIALGNDEDVKDFMRNYFDNEIANKFTVETSFKGDGDIPADCSIKYDNQLFIEFTADMDDGGGEFELTPNQSKLIFCKLAIESGVTEIQE
ncbi:MAG TPA: hypothetical protein VHQ20_01415 [Patescibacteria group bacterium]|jgi:hypothetical protein|nr:hypothetical protein [Patescibacteria group bacterium]